MTRRYYHPDLPTSGGLVQLCEAEFQHAVRVMRVQVGDEIELFDGQGHQAAAVIREISKRGCQCEVCSLQAVDREPGRYLDLSIALPKPDRARALIERLTELGVKSVTPLMAARTQRRLSAKLLARLRLGSIEACKQSGRNVLVQINEPVRAADFFSSCPGDLVRWIAHPDAPPLECFPQSAGDFVVAAIGPEGGWTDEEVSIAMDAGFRPVGLGKRILRVETAATLLAARLLD